MLRLIYIIAKAKVIIKIRSQNILILILPSHCSKIEEHLKVGKR